MTLSATQNAILQTLAYFDVLNYPLTLLELRKFLSIAITAGDLSAELQAEPIKKILSQKNGHCCLAGQEEIIEIRRQRYGLALKKLRLARRYAGWLNRFPWVEAVGIYSSLSLKNSRPDSDLDFIILTSPNRAWSARFFINLFLKAFRLRPRRGCTADKICISYLADRNNLNLAKVNGNDYYYYGTGAFCFLTGRPETIADFFSANDWVRTYLPNWQPTVWNRWPDYQSPSRRLMALLELIPEKLCRDFQLKILPDKYKQAADGQKVVLSDGLIKLHNNDKRLKYRQLFMERFQQIINAND